MKEIYKKYENMYYEYSAGSDIEEIIFSIILLASMILMSGIILM